MKLNVLVDKNKIDLLANAISAKSGESLTLTLDEMVEAVDGIEAHHAPTLETVTKTYTPTTSQQTDTITPSQGYDGIEEVDVTVNPIPSQYIVPTGNVNISQSGQTNVTNYATATVPYSDFDAYYNGTYGTKNNQRIWALDGGIMVFSGGWLDSGDVSIIKRDYNAIPTGTSVTPTESPQTIGGADTMMEGAVTVNAISSTYVGSGITQRSSSDLTASGATVTVPSGYYSAQASKSVSTGSEGTPTATKGSVSNHSVSVTPSVTNTAGYITGGTKTGTAVTVSASELVSGTYTVDSSGTKDVTTYASASVPSGTAGTPSASKGAVSNHSVSVTPSVTNTTGWITGSTINGTAVTVSASELVSGSDTVTQNDTYDVTNLAEIVVNVPSGGGSVTITDVANATGTTCSISTGGSPTPSETWETIWEGTKAPNADTPYNYLWFQEMPDVYPTTGSVWKVTVNGTPYRCTAYYSSSLSAVAFGNPKYSGGTDDGSDAPFNFYNVGWGALVGDTELTAGVYYQFKFERLVTS